MPSGPLGVSQTDHNRVAYHALARQICDPWNSNRKRPTARPDIAQITAEAQNSILDLNALQLDDPDLRLIRDESRTATEEAIAAIRSLDRLPPPPNSGDMFLTGFLCGLSGRFDLAAEAAQGAQTQVDAVSRELRALRSAFDRACSAKLLLKRAAPKFTRTGNLNRLAVDIDEGFILDQDTWITLHNTTGKDLHNALVAVHLVGQNGETKENTHFVPDWGSGARIYAPYSPGLAAQGVIIGQQAVGSLHVAKVRVLADEGRVDEFVYQYAGDEKLKDVKRELDAVRADVVGSHRNGALNGKVFILNNRTGRSLPNVSVTSSAGAHTPGILLPGHSFEVGKLQVARNFRPGESVTVYIGGYELGAFTFGGP